MAAENAFVEVISHSRMAIKVTTVELEKLDDIEKVMMKEAMPSPSMESKMVE